MNTNDVTEKYTRSKIKRAKKRISQLRQQGGIKRKTLVRLAGSLGRKEGK